jgi:hydrogenase-4 component B
VSNLAIALAGAGGLFLIGVASVWLQRLAFGRVATYGGALAIMLMECAVGLSTLTGVSASAVLSLPVGLPWLRAHFSLDLLSAAFLVVVGLGGSVASLYALGYGRHETAPGRVLPFFAVFLGAMVLVLLAADAFTFLFSWELMSLASWALVLAHHRGSENVRAGYLYLLMAGMGTVTLLLAFGLLAGVDGDYAFADMRAAMQSPVIAGAVLCLALVGAGSKAGLVPVHAWLPLAHPVAPSHVSALLSGVMTKVAVYGFVRIVFDLLGTPQAWWAILILMVAAATTLLGVLYALMQHDLKRLLAYHTVENIGIIFIGLGLALAFEVHDMPWAAGLALTAALFHVLNHSLFKSLLFLGAGAVLSATGERDLERLGGLIRVMPVTAFLFLVGAAAISALPPLNGFVSEWLTFQAILLSPDLPNWGLKLLVPAVGAILALSAALAAACFVKAFGITFLGRPRSDAASNAQEVDRFSLAAMGVLGVFCVVAGILPGYVIDVLRGVTGQLVGGVMPVQTRGDWFAIVPIADTRSAYDGFVLLVLIASAALLVATFIHRFATRAVRRAPPWDCGFPDASPRTQYTGTSFAQPIRRVFGSVVFAAREEVDMAPPGESRPSRILVALVDPIWIACYLPVSSAVERATARLAVFQMLSIRQYLALVFAALVTLLGVLALWP